MRGEDENAAPPFRLNDRSVAVHVDAGELLRIEDPIELGGLDGGRRGGVSGEAPLQSVLGAIPDPPPMVAGPIVLDDHAGATLDGSDLRRAAGPGWTEADVASTVTQAIVHRLLEASGAGADREWGAVGMLERDGDGAVSR